MILRGHSEARIRTRLLRLLLTAVPAGVLLAGCPAGPASDAQRYATLVDARQVSLARGALSADGEGVDDALMILLVKDPRVLALTDLSFAHNHLTVAGLTTLLSSPKSEALRVLDLADNPLGDPALVALSRSPRLATIEVLQLSQTGIGPAGAQTLGALPPGGLALRQLDLSHNPLGEEGALALASLPVAARLSLEDTRMGANGAQALIASTPCPRLMLADNALGSGSLAPLTRISPTLEALSLARTRLGAGDTVTLAGLPAPALRELDLRGNPLGDEGVRALAKAKWFPQLNRLDVADTDATSVSLEALQAAWGTRGGLVLRTAASEPQAQ